MDRDIAQKLSNKIRAILREEFKDTGYTLEFTPGSINQTDYITKITVCEADESGQSVGGEVAVWNREAERLGLNVAWLGQTYTNKGRTMTIRGLNKRRCKNRVMATDQNGKEWKTTPSAIIMHMRIGRPT